ncbi:ubiquinol-cytochrome c reductase iron-sulfur subunit [Nocardioides yefusunii]|uniref:Cytochrome bc1 complex Rieske iron-sulfur subunit n=1 Tax=Nocardioides yefusunii TaxID=2500546 RepID=A0ABW1QV09_9ACTN|nr:Rieske 2Fe-2S domain-containing protein [Nocardioides yefusunii]
MSNHDSNLPEVTENDLFPNPGVPAHTPRPTDVDPKAEKRAERQVAMFFVASLVFAVLFIVSYFKLSVGDDWDTWLGFGASTVALGVTMGLALMCIGIGVIQWSRKLMTDVEVVDYRHAVASPEEDRAVAIAELEKGLAEAGIARRPLVRNTLLAALGGAGAMALVSFRDLGPSPWDVDDADKGEGLRHTLWKKGERIARDVVGTPILASELEIGDLVNAQPFSLLEVDEKTGQHKMHGGEVQVAKSKASLILLRMHPDDIKPGEGRENWDVNGIVAYSKICTHVGCPISLNERTTHHLLCPCHQSTFDLADSGKVVFGPAHRALPQLPIAVDAEGYLIAQSDFTEPVGPSYWEREKK